LDKKLLLVFEQMNSLDSWVLALLNNKEIEKPKYQNLIKNLTTSK
jgi:hypothetical protein